MSRSRTCNRLLASLPLRDRTRILNHSETVELRVGTVLCELGARYEHVYFPLTGFISTVATVGGHRAMEISLIGAEGMLGATLALGIATSPLRALVQGTGMAQRMRVEDFCATLTHSQALRRLLRRYLFVLMTQLSKGSVCNRFHRVDARLARWLLMTHDRAVADRFHLTHDLLSAMLGARRSGVSVAAAILQRDGLIRYTRGDIRVLDRRGLEARTCECYGADAAEYSAVFARDPRSSAPTRRQAGITLNS